MGYFETSLKCIAQRKFVNIPAWHEHGFTGKGITIFHDDLGETSHNACCKDVIQTILPDARVLSGSISWHYKDGAMESCNIKCNEMGETLPFEDFIVKYDVSQINNSTGAGDNGDNLETPQSRYFREMIQKHNLFCTGSAGNYKGMTNKYQGAFVLVSGAYLVDGRITDYGSEGSPVDFSMFMGFQSGTSFASPFLNGMAGLVRCKYGRITQAEIYDYFKNHCKDLGEPGDDVYYGWGLPILGEPSMRVVLQIGKGTALVEGKEVLLDQAPVIDKGSNRTLIPLRFISETFGAKVEWNDADKTIVIER